MTPQELAAALQARRHELGLKWWQVHVQINVSDDAVRRMRRGLLSQATRERAEAWLRLPGQPRTE